MQGQLDWDFLWAHAMTSYLQFLALLFLWYYVVGSCSVLTDMQLRNTGGINSHLNHPWPMGERNNKEECFLLCLQGKHFWDAIHKTLWKVLADQELAAHRDGQLNTSLCWLCLLPVLLFPSCSLALYESYPKITYLQGYFCLRFVWKPRLS